MNEICFRVEMQTIPSKSFDFVTLIYNDYQKQNYEGNLFYLIYFEMMRIIGTKLKSDRQKEKEDIMAQLALWNVTPMMQIKRQVSDGSQNFEIVCPYFVIDQENIILQDVPGTDHFEILNQGIYILQLDPRQVYTFSLKQRVNEVQRSDLVSAWTVDSRVNINVLFLLTNMNKTELLSYKNSDLLFKKLLQHSDKCDVKIEQNGEYETLKKESLNDKMLIDTSDKRYEITNYMTFRVSADIIPDEMIQLSFESYLDKNGLLEKRRLMDYIKNVSKMEKTSQKHFYIPFINVCQSSGSGKSKIAAELMKEFPASYVVLRDHQPDQYSYPPVSNLSSLFLSPSNIEIPEDYLTTSDEASKSIIGRYLLVMKALFKDYLDTIKPLIFKKKTAALKDIHKLFVEGKFLGYESELLRETNFNNICIDSRTWSMKIIGNDANYSKCTIEEAIGACQSHLADIFKLEVNKEEMPFVLIIDEASLLTNEPSGKISLFRLFRRAVYLLGPTNDFVVLTLGTNSDIVDLNPGPTINSFRGSIEGKLFPIFVLNRIWDIYFDCKDFIKTPIGYYSLRCGKMLTFLFSLGRPVWSSIKLSSLVFFAEKKVTNGSLQSGEAYLAFWMIRTGLLTNPAHVINSYLVSSLMATLLFASPSLDYIRVYYPSEPALAIAARKILDSLVDLETYYRTLEKFIEMRAVDQGKYSEIISMDITLRAISEAKTVSCDWVNESKLPSVCATRQFILETRIDENASESFKKAKLQQEKYDTTVGKEEEIQKGNPSGGENRANLMDEKKEYRIVTVKSFLISMYGEGAYAKIKTIIPKRIKSGLINTSHLIQFQRDFPKDIKLKPFNQGTAENSLKTSPCDLFTSQALGAAAARGTGIICPPNYFGLDYVIPVVLKPLPLLDEKELVIGIEENENVVPVEVSLEVSDKVPAEPLSLFKLASLAVRPPNEPIAQELASQIQNLEISPAATSGDSNIAAGKSLNYLDLDESNDSEDENTTQFSVEEEDFEASPQYTMIGIQVKRASPGNIKKVVAKGALSNHIVKCGIHNSEVACTCEFRLKDAHYEDILRNGLILVHSMSGNSGEVFSQSEAEIKFNCLHSGPIKNLPKNYQDRVKTNETFKPKEHLDIQSECRFSPDVHLSGKVQSNIDIHVMFKKRAGFTERLTAIHSTGLSVFNNGNVLPENVAEIASRIILNDRGLFSEVSKTAVNTYNELIASVIARSNDGSYPLGSNMLRSSYGQPLLQPELPNYTTLSFSNLQYFGRDPDEENKKKRRQIPK